jgi:hypothetical protein
VGNIRVMSGHVTMTDSGKLAGHFEPNKDKRRKDVLLRAAFASLGGVPYSTGRSIGAQLPGRINSDA